MSEFPLKEPTPDYEALEKVILGKEEPKRVHFVEEFVDVEVVDYIVQNMMEEDFPSLDEAFASVGSTSHLTSKIEKFLKGGPFKILDGKPDEIRIERDIAFYYRMGYDYVPDLAPWSYLGILFQQTAVNYDKSLQTRSLQRLARDTAPLSRGVRYWQEEKFGLIRSWEDFERFPWSKINLDILDLDTYYAYIKPRLPDGMKVAAIGALFNPGVVGTFFGFEDLCHFLYKQPDLVKAVVDEWGQLIYELYERVISYDCVGFLWHADDLGYKTQTLISPEHLRQYIFPWFKKYAELAHRHGKMFWLHSCGNVYSLMDDLIEDVGIDAKHSFEDEILPITEFMKQYGNRVAGLGGVDMDKLCRLEETSLRKYCRSILDSCMPIGRYAFGSGNTIANYVPVQNYLIMMEEGYRYGK